MAEVGETAFAVGEAGEPCAGTEGVQQRTQRGDRAVPLPAQAF